MYEKQNFTDGQVLEAEHLNKMEDGIAKASVQTDWNQTDETAADFLKNKPFRVANINWETGALDMSLSEIDSFASSGVSVLFSPTMTFIGVSTDGGEPSGASSIALVAMEVEDEAPTLIIQRYNFAADGSLAGIDMALWSGGVLVPAG